MDKVVASEAAGEALHTRMRRGERRRRRRSVGELMAKAEAMRKTLL